MKAPGPIPACAGQPQARDATKMQPPAYPRVCGATATFAAKICRVLGLSPRVRGNLRSRQPPLHYSGPIPACAGQPAWARYYTGNTGAYPRVCGATCKPRPCCRDFRGLSPRVRGNRRLIVLRFLALRPIPACAGQPDQKGAIGQVGGAYPRVCGATAVTGALLIPLGGLSPRVRGNRRPAPNYSDRGGPIPACAGQPLVPNSLSYKRKAGNLCLGF